ncbi:HAMP domain-containing histidine kinase [Desulfotalea psychrophila]|uniref:histidine kinase n=1 Tax=Desulfotalea psychrophila TaxID=84980 RepID=A0ABS3ASE9_9BACT|nr:HAMP domain-containing histidine kinase [Desulfocapsa sp.]MBN4065231.1 HAMP domain-containing histidine kinase [Desulfocapsa sp. AH-315-G09]MBN4068046.1 HAMP domain-containing histidine kinase [Desulfotalea psychrophila]MBN4071756.1 HAMP domain-containing histidine kinase [Desulfotalea psychrophila]
MNNYKHSWFSATFKPIFLNRKHRENSLFKQLFSYKRLYRLSLLVMTWLALGPLIGIVIIGHLVTKRNVDELISCQLSHTADKIRQEVSCYIEQRKTALDLVADTYTSDKIKKIVPLNDKRLNDLMAETQDSGMRDAYLVDQDGFIHARLHQRNDKQIKVKLPPQLFQDSDIRILKEENSTTGENMVKVYADIPATSLVLVLTKPESLLLQSYFGDRRIVFWFLSVSLLFIAVLVYATATRLVNEVFIADQQRIRTLREIEHSNKLASVGRLAAGVGHEINNPLAIINEKAGMIQDIITFEENYKDDEQLAGLTSSILTTVKRCSAITRRLLTFARHLDDKIETVNIKQILEGILDLLHKESEHRRFTITIEEIDSPPSFECDHGKLQQIFFNLINNSFAAMQDGGTLAITIRHLPSAVVAVSISDDGCGIAEENVDHIFEPFFFTISQSGGTGLGLSVTYALVQEIDGSIEVSSEQGGGTRFIVEIPAKKGVVPGIIASDTGGRETGVS